MFYSTYSGKEHDFKCNHVQLKNTDTMKEELSEWNIYYSKSYNIASTRVWKFFLIYQIYFSHIKWAFPQKIIISMSLFVSLWKLYRIHFYSWFLIHPDKMKSEECFLVKSKTNNLFSQTISFHIMYFDENIYFRLVSTKN